MSSEMVGDKSGGVQTAYGSNVVALRSDVSERHELALPIAKKYQHSSVVHALRPFRHLLNGTVLEVGNDEGELPLFIAETAVRVTALRQNAATVQRVLTFCAKAPKVLAATNSLSACLGRSQFDVVVMMDLPSSTWGSSTKDGAGKVAATLARARSHLKPNGILIVAMDNRFALRHLAGHGEVGRSYQLFSLEGLTRPDGFVLPSRRELQGVLRDLGLSHQDWWFPFPDHRSSLTVVSERGLDPSSQLDIAALLAPTIPFDPRRAPHATFSIQRALTATAEAGLLADLSNAFVVACSERPFETQRALALHYGHSRRPEFEKEVRFESVGNAIQVRRQPLYCKEAESLDGVSNVFPNESFEAGYYWPANLQIILAQPGWVTTDLTEWALVWQRAVVLTYGLLQSPTLSTVLPSRAIDSIPRNLIVGPCGSAFIDVEWDLGEPIEFGWLLVRGLLDALQQSMDCAQPSGGTSVRLIDIVIVIAASLGYCLDLDHLRAYFASESRLQTIVAGRSIEVSLETFANVQLHLRSSYGEQLELAEQSVALRDATLGLKNDIYDELSSEHRALKQHLSRVETEQLHSQFRADREIRTLRTERDMLSKEKTRLEEEIVRLSSAAKPTMASLLDRFGMLFRRSSLFS